MNKSFAAIVSVLLLVLSSYRVAALRDSKTRRLGQDDLTESDGNITSLSNVPAIHEATPRLMTAKDGWAYAAKIVERIKAPTFPDRDFDVTEYGAVDDGITDCTAAFRKAIEICHELGGGRVVVPPGRNAYLTGPITLLSNVNLHVSEGATIKFTTDKSAYMPLVQVRNGGIELMNYSPLIYAFEQSNIAITGTGTLDGSASESVWWDWKLGPDFDDNGPERESRAVLIEQMERGVPVEDRKFGEGHHIRPNFLVPFRCQNVLVEGITITNSPAWTIHPTFCKNVIVRGVTVDSPYGPNNDGCAVDSSQDVLIEESTFNAGDDNVVIKSGKGDEGRRVGIPTKNVVVRKCNMLAGHGGFVAGSELGGGAQNLFVADSDWNSPDLKYGLRIKSNRLWGGRVDGVFARNIRIQRVEKAAIRINMKYKKVKNGPYTPQVSNIFVENMVSKRSRYALLLEGLSNARPENIMIVNSSFENCRKRNVVEYVGNLLLEGVNFDYSR